jgi:hypothetical protein
MDDLLSRFLTDLAGRTSGPFAFRFVLQPLMAVFYAYRDGSHDARAGRPPYFRTVFTDPVHRGALLRDGFKSVGRVIGLGLIMDVLYQVIVFREIWPGEMIVIVLLLAFVPYLLLRGPFNRFMRGRLRATSHQ